MRRQVGKASEFMQALESRTLMDSSLAAVPRELLTTSADIQSVVTADFNGDGRLDLAVSAGREVFVLLKNPRVGFARPIVTRLASTVGSLEVANLDGDGTPDLVAFGGRAAGGQKVVLRALLGRGDGRFTLADRAFIAMPPSDENFMAVGDIFTGGPLAPPPFATDEVVLGSSAPSSGADLRMYRFENGRFDGGSVIAAGSPGSSFVRPVFHDVDGDRDLDVVTARNAADTGTVVAVLMGVLVGPGPTELLIAHRQGRIDSVLVGDLGRGTRVLFSSTGPDDHSGFFTRPGPTVVESVGFAGEDLVEIYRDTHDEYIYGDVLARTIRLLSITDSNSDGRADLIAEERWSGPRPNRQSVIPFAIHRESALVQFIAPADALGTFQAVRTHHLGGRTSPGLPLAANYDPRYLIGNLAGTAAADLVMFRDRTLLLGLGDSGQEAPVISRLQGAEILPAVVGAFGFSAEGVYDTDAVRGGFVTNVRAYLDSNDNGRWDVGDALIGIDQNGADGWHIGGIASPDWPDSGRVFVVAQDDRGLLSNVLEWRVSVPRLVLMRTS